MGNQNYRPCNDNMTRPDQQPVSGGDETTAGASRRVGAAIAGVLALLVFGGLSWAVSTDVNGPREGARSAPAAALETTGQSPTGRDRPSTAAPTETAATASAPPSVAGPGSKGPLAADPAQVNRKDKSEKELANIPQPVASPVDLNAKNTVKAGVTATISTMESVQGEARGIGEIAGPALRFTLTITNDTDKVLSMASALVNVTFGADESPAAELSGPGTRAFPGSVAAGATATAVYVFSVPPDSRDDVRIYFNLEAETPIASFAGRAPA